MMYEFEIIDATKFRKLKKYRYGLYYFLIFLVFLVNKPKKRFQLPNRPNSVAELLGLDVRLLVFSLIIVGLIAFFLHYYSQKYEILGKLVIDDLKIIAETAQQKIEYQFDSISTLNIERHATWHYQYRDDNYLEKTNNWIEIVGNDKKIKYEFSISSSQNNIDFEEMIKFLNRKPFVLYYKSI